MKKAILSFAVAILLIVSTTIPVLASTVNAADTWKTGAGGRASTGKATVSSDNTGSINTVIGDDAEHDSVAGRSFTEGADGARIYVWAKVVEANLQHTIYAVDIEWKDMKFVYHDGDGQWNSANHENDGALSATAGWQVHNAYETGSTPTEFYLEQGNNLIKVTNHSNGAITASFDYNHLTATVFNSSSGDDNVVGGFYDSENAAKTGASILTGPSTNAEYNTLVDGKIALPTAVGRAVDDSDLVGSVYFAPSGTPDAGKSSELADFSHVGVITISITPNSDTGLNTAGTSKQP